MIRQKALAELSPLTRIAYRMVRELGATHRVTARSMGISVGLVSFHLRRAERHLVKRLVDVPTWSSTPPTMRRTSRTRERTPQS
jgi:DNA-directed RNA polymerase specialized sigma24 family protein